MFLSLARPIDGNVKKKKKSKKCRVSYLQENRSGKDAGILVQLIQTKQRILGEHGTTAQELVPE